MKGRVDWIKKQLIESEGNFMKIVSQLKDEINKYFNE